MSSVLIYSFVLFADRVSTLNLMRRFFPLASRCSKKLKTHKRDNFTEFVGGAHIKRIAKLWIIK